MTVYSIGHSTRPIGKFLGLLEARGIRTLADIRTVPKSRHVPQYNSEALAADLRRSGVAYLHLPELGGLRKPRKDSANLGWRNKGFRGYADHMESPEFERGLERLLEEARKAPLAFMCAEAVPWRCHRNLVSDALTARGFRVEHITEAGTTSLHKLTPFAKVDDGKVSYPGEEPEQPDLGFGDDA